MAGQGSGLYGDVLGHELRGRIVVALWHSSIPLSAPRLRDDYLPDVKGVLTGLSYHLRVLERAGVIEVQSVEREHPCYVVGGPNSSEAVRRLNLSNGGSA